VIIFIYIYIYIYKYISFIVLHIFIMFYVLVLSVIFTYVLTFVVFHTFFLFLNPFHIKNLMLAMCCIDFCFCCCFFVNKYDQLRFLNHHMLHTS
jgi:hypothetical protein